MLKLCFHGEQGSWDGWKSKTVLVGAKQVETSSVGTTILSWVLKRENSGETSRTLHKIGCLWPGPLNSCSKVSLPLRCLRVLKERLNHELNKSNGPNTWKSLCTHGKSVNTHKLFWLHFWDRTLHNWQGGSWIQTGSFAMLIVRLRGETDTQHCWQQQVVVNVVPSAGGNHGWSQSTLERTRKKRKAR